MCHGSDVDTLVGQDHEGQRDVEGHRRADQGIWPIDQKHTTCVVGASCQGSSLFNLERREGRQKNNEDLHAVIIYDFNWPAVMRYPKMNQLINLDIKLLNATFRLMGINSSEITVWVMSAWPISKTPFTTGIQLYTYSFFTKMLAVHIFVLNWKYKEVRVNWKSCRCLKMKGKF